MPLTSYCQARIQTWRCSISTLTRPSTAFSTRSGSHCCGCSLCAPDWSMLAEIAVAVDERHRHHRRPQIGSGTQSVTRQHSQAAAIRRHVGVQRDLHGKVGNIRGFRPWLHKKSMRQQAGGTASPRLPENHLSTRAQRGREWSVPGCFHLASLAETTTR